MVDQQITALDERPLVSVIIPAYNAELFIEETLKSVLAQTYKNIEVIVVDDGSQDRTAEIVNKFREIDQRVILVTQVNSGVAVARNTAIEKSQGEFIAPIDADDIWYPDNIAKQVECMLASPGNVGVVYSWSIDIDQQGSPTGQFRACLVSGRVYSTLFIHNFTGNARSTLIRRNCLAEIGGYRGKLPEKNVPEEKDQRPFIICEDWDLYLRIATNYEYRVVPEFLVGYRKLYNSRSANCQRLADSYELMWESIKKEYPLAPHTMYNLSKSRLYMYLAQQSHSCKQYKETLNWLRKSFLANFLAPFLGWDVYILFFTSIIGILMKNDEENFVKHSLKSKSIICQETSDISINEIQYFNPQKLQVKLKIILGNILHKIAPIIFGEPKNWLNPSK